MHFFFLCTMDIIKARREIQCHGSHFHLACISVWLKENGDTLISFVVLVPHVLAVPIFRTPLEHDFLDIYNLFLLLLLYFLKYSYYGLYGWVDDLATLLFHSCYEIITICATACFVFRDLASPQQSLGPTLQHFFLQFVMSAAGTQEEQAIDELKPAHGGELKRIPLFFVAKRLT